MIASVSGVAMVRPCPPRAWSAWPCVTSALATGCDGSIQESAGTTWMPCGSARIHAKLALMGTKMGGTAWQFHPLRYFGDGGEALLLAGLGFGLGLLAAPLRLGLEARPLGRRRGQLEGEVV